MKRTKKDITYWAILGTFATGLLAFIIYLIVRPYSHKPEAGIENASSSLTPNNMETPDQHYDTKVRGYRNNNPLNIRTSSNKWLGEIRPSTDGSFCQFKNMAYGFRAAMACIRTYIRLRGCKTISEIIHRWAPFEDGNNPIRYTNRVCKTWENSFTPDTVIDYRNKDQMVKLVYAMAIVENGSEPLMADCEQAFNLL